MFVYCYLRKNLFPRADGLPVPKFTDNFAKAFLHFIQRFKKLVFKCTDEELKEAYDIAVQLVEPFAKFSWEEQVQGIMKTFREYFENGMTYSTSTPYYNEPLWLSGFENGVLRGLYQNDGTLPEHFRHSL